MDFHQTATNLWSSNSESSFQEWWPWYARACPYPTVAINKGGVGEGEAGSGRKSFGDGGGGGEKRCGRKSRGCGRRWRYAPALSMGLGDGTRSRLVGPSGRVPQRVSIKRFGGGLAFKWGRPCANRVGRVGVQGEHMGSAEIHSSFFPIPHSSQVERNSRRMLYDLTIGIATFGLTIPQLLLQSPDIGLLHRCRQSPCAKGPFQVPANQFKMGPVRRITIPTLMT
jgi:hypothetical protein